MPQRQSAEVRLRVIIANSHFDCENQAEMKRLDDTEDLESIGKTPYEGGKEEMEEEEEEEKDIQNHIHCLSLIMEQYYRIQS